MHISDVLKLLTMNYEYVSLMQKAAATPLEEGLTPNSSFLCDIDGVNFNIEDLDVIKKQMLSVDGAKKKGFEVFQRKSLKNHQ